MPLPEYSHMTTASLAEDALELRDELELDNELKLELDNELEDKLELTWDEVLEALDSPSGPEPPQAASVVRLSATQNRGRCFIP